MRAMAHDERGVAEACAAFSAVIGPEHVVTDPKLLARLGTATFSTEARVLAWLRPGNAEEVRGVLRVSSARAMPLYVVSGGKNWGLGSRVPPRDAVLLDLGRLNQIIAFDEELATVTVEPGVTFRQLYDFLRERGSRTFASTTGGSPEGSVLANALERGDGSGPNGDRASSVAALEVMLSTGEVVHTGFERFAGARTAALHRFGVGPALDGLFTQSNLGVVTRGTVWLSPLPRYLAAIRFSIRSDARLGPLVDGLRRLRLDGTLTSAVGIWNDYRVLSVSEQYPWQRMQGVTPLSREVLDEKRRAFDGSRWMGLASIYAPSVMQGEAAVRHVESELGALVEALSVEAESGEPTSGNELFPVTDPGFAFLQGVPHEQSLRSMYYRKRAPAPVELDPDQDRVGVLWLCPLLPLRGADVVTATELVERRMLECGFEPLLALVSSTPRTLQLLPMIVYDRDQVGADARALECHDELLAELVALGYLPHRLALPAQDSLPASRDDHGAVLERLKRTLDPSDVLAPGRYDFRSTWPKR